MFYTIIVLVNNWFLSCTKLFSLYYVHRCYGYSDTDEGPPSKPPNFLPERLPGLQLSEVITREDARQFTRPVDFFKLLFTFDIVGTWTKFSK